MLAAFDGVLELGPASATTSCWSGPGLAALDATDFGEQWACASSGWTGRRGDRRSAL
jgi:hypothetical protein